MTATIRECRPEDLPAVLEILELKRLNLERFEPIFWKRKPGIEETSIAFLGSLLESERTVALVADEGASLSGFLIATEMPSPPVYDAGPTAVLDDYYVRSPEDWPTVGAQLLAEARVRLAKRGYKQIVAASAYKDTAKMVFLREQGLSLATGWFTTAL